jgi:hypothetical protein
MMLAIDFACGDRDSLAWPFTPTVDFEMVEFVNKDKPHLMRHASPAKRVACL